MLFSLSHDKTSFQNSEDTSQRESKCVKDSGSLLQKVQFGDCERPKRNIYHLYRQRCSEFVLKFSQFGIKCSTERKRINLCPINDCV